MPSNNRQTNNYPNEDNAVEKFKPKTIDGCNTCPPKKSCEGPEITFETSGCLDGGGSINLRQIEDEIIPLHVDCPGNGKLTVTTCESIDGGGEFTANQQCGTDIELCINNNWLDRFVMSRIGNGKLVIGHDGTLTGGGVFTANQGNDTAVTLGVKWDTFPACGGSSGFLWTGSCWRVEWGHLAQCPEGGLQWDGNCWRVDWALWPACAGGGLVWQDGCWMLDTNFLKDFVEDLLPEPEPGGDGGGGDGEDGGGELDCEGHEASGKECETNDDCPECEECAVTDSFEVEEISTVFRTTFDDLTISRKEHEQRISELEAQVKTLTEQLAKLMA